jgi:hypothetical protein
MNVSEEHYATITPTLKVETKYSSEMSVTTIRLHGVRIQKETTDIFTAVRTDNLSWYM